MLKLDTTYAAFNEINLTQVWLNKTFDKWNLTWMLNLKLCLNFKELPVIFMMAYFNNKFI